MGATGAQGPAGPAGTTGQSLTSVFGTSSLTVAEATESTVVPGLSQTVTVTSGQLVRITSTGGIENTVITQGAYTQVDVVVFVDGEPLANGGYARVTAINGTGTGTSGGSLGEVITNWSLDVAPTLSAGTHTIEIVTLGTGLSNSQNAMVSGNNTSVLQGTLTVQVLN